MIDPGKSYNLHSRSGVCDECGCDVDAGTVCIPPTTAAEVKEMSKKDKTRDTQVRHRLSGAALLGIKEPTPPTMAVDAAPRAGDVRARNAALMQSPSRLSPEQQREWFANLPGEKHEFTISRGGNGPPNRDAIIYHDERTDDE